MGKLLLKLVIIYLVNHLIQINNILYRFTYIDSRKINQNTSQTKYYSTGILSKAVTKTGTRINVFGTKMCSFISGQH